MNLSGKSGLMYIPDALEVSDGMFSLGYNYNPVNYGLRSKGSNPERTLFANLTVVPRLDISFSLLQIISTNENKVKEALGDRQLDIRYLLMKEKEKWPSIAIALSTPFTIDAAMLTQVIVATKQFKLSENVGLEATAGYGSPYFLYRSEDNLTNSNIFSNMKWQKKSEYKFNNGYLTGPFGGVKLDYQKKAGLMAEWDSQKLNLGAYGIIGKRWTVQAGLLNFDQVMFGSSFAVDLFKPTRKIEKLYE
ncbi:hypothetical protein GVN16_05810 [Emticicia sp. CRIBPO]|nr:hypothetical protein [Emticicia sp. CRIBPO]